jgi:hypothetical protein
VHRSRLNIVRPCALSWDELRGEGSVRSCDSCEQRVYDLSSLTEREAEQALAVRPEHACVRCRIDAQGNMIFRPATVPVFHPYRKAVVTTLAAAALVACAPVAEQPLEPKNVARVEQAAVPVPSAPKLETKITPELASARPEPEPQTENVAAPHEASEKKWEEFFPPKREPIVCKDPRRKHHATEVSVAPAKPKKGAMAFDEMDLLGEPYRR